MNQAASKLKNLLIVLGLVLAGCHSHVNRTPAVGAGSPGFELDRIVEDIVYSASDWPQELHGDLYLPARRGPLPVVLTIHGGGWANRGRDDMDGISRKLTGYGFAVFNINYRFAPRYTYPAQLLDVQQALRWLAIHAAAYRLDSERINTWGYSSGAHLAALAGGRNGRAVDLPRIRAVVAGGIPADLRKYSGSPIVMRFMGGDRDEMPERYAEASPAYHVNPQHPPVFLYHGKLDLLVTPDQATDYFDALQTAGVDAELYLHNWRGHTTMFLFGDDAEDRAIDFLVRKNSASQISSRQ